MPTLEKPKALDSMADGIDKYIYREYVKEYEKDNCALTRSAKKLYPLILGQCTEGPRTKMKVTEYYKRIGDKSNSAEILTIKEIAFKVNTGFFLHDDMEGKTGDL